MQNRIDWIEVARISIKEIWDNVLAFIAIVSTILIEDEALPLTIFLSIIACTLVISMVATILEVKNQLREKNVPLIINIGDDDDFVEGMRYSANQLLLPFHFKPKQYQKFFDVEKADMTVHSEESLTANPGEWYRILRRFESKVNLLNTHLRGRRNFHIFMKCPVALALGLGAVSGSKNAVILYHHIDSRYAKVFDLHCDEETAMMGTHALKNPIKPPFKYFEVIEPDEIKPTLYIAIGAASHPPLSDVIKHANGEKDVCTLQIENTYGNTLAVDEDWRRAAQECITVIREWVTKKEVKNAEIFISSPLPLAFGIGMGLGTPTRITINHWFREENAYHSVFNLNEI